jgi:hypothetical protein
VKGVKRPKVESYEGKTPALGDGQAQALLDAPGAETRSRGGAIGLSSDEPWKVEDRGEKPAIALKGR